MEPTILRKFRSSRIWILSGCAAVIMGTGVADAAELTPHDLI
jgi:hypothetical protein